MKSLLKAFGAVTLSGAMVIVPALAGTDAPADTKDLKKVLEDNGINYVETAQKGITLSGYVDTSYTDQFVGGPQTFSSSGAGGTAKGNLLRQFDTADGDRCRVETLERQHRFNPVLDPAMVLLIHVAQVLAGTQPNSARHGACRFHLCHRPM